MPCRQILINLSMWLNNNPSVFFHFILYEYTYYLIYLNFYSYNLRKIIIEIIVFSISTNGVYGHGYRRNRKKLPG